jgi:uncharacterized membrane protein
MTKRKVYSGSSGNNNRRHGGHKRPVQGSNTPSSQPHSRPKNNENYRGNRPFQPQSILPSPAILQEYEYATDGAASRIIEMAEIEQDRRNEWEAEYMRFYKKSMRLGQLFGFLLLVMIVLVTMFLSSQGHDDVAMVLAGSAFFSVAVASVFSGGSQRKNSRRPRNGYNRERSYDRSERPEKSENQEEKA